MQPLEDRDSDIAQREQASQLHLHPLTRYPLPLQFSHPAQLSFPSLEDLRLAVFEVKRDDSNSS